MKLFQPYFDLIRLLYLHKIIEIFNQYQINFERYNLSNLIEGNYYISLFAKELLLILFFVFIFSSDILIIVKVKGIKNKKNFQYNYY